MQTSKKIINSLIQGEMTIILGLIFLFFSPLILMFGQEAMVEKIAAWVYMFWLLGIIQLIINSFRKKRKIFRKNNFSKP